MATKKDLVEAHAFTRRRLVTAFLSGAPGGREVEPSRPGGMVVGGIALGVLLIAGAAVGSVLSPRSAADWENPGLILSKDTGERYVITEESTGDDPDIRPVINVTSAQLILGVDVEPTLIQQDALDQITPGADIGILGAPQQLPTSEDFVNTGWTACTAAARVGEPVSDGLKISAASRPDVRPTPNEAFLVAEGAGKRLTYWLIAEADDPEDPSAPPRASRFKLGPDVGDDLMEQLNLVAKDTARVVSPQYLSLFPEGPELTRGSFGLRGEGTPASGCARVGDLLQAGDRFYVYTSGAPWRLTPFEAAVYQATHPSAQVHDGPAPGNTVEVEATKGWPSRIPTGAPRGELCGVLHTGEGEPPYVTLASDPGDDASAAEVPPGSREAVMEPGHGALVTSGDWAATTSDSIFVVDNQAKAYSLVGTTTLENLQYDPDEAPLVPDPWVKSLNKGIQLSTELALCPPALEPNDSQECE